MKKLMPAALLGALSVSGGAFAEFSESPPVDFALRLSSHKGDLDYNGSLVDTRAKRASLSWRERYYDRLDLGLVLGYSRIKQFNNPVTAGMTLDGYHVGFSVDVDLYRTDRFRAYAGAAYTYQSVEHETSTDTVTLSLDEPSAQLGVAFALGRRLWLHAAVRQTKIDGDEQQSGTVNQTTAVERDAKTGGSLGLELELDDKDYVGIAGESGINRGVMLYFGHRY